MNTENLLGVGSRVKHPAYGDGVVIRLHPIAYEVTFMLYGTKMVGKEYDKWTVVDAVPADSAVTFSDAEKSLIRILRQYTDLERNRAPWGPMGGRTPHSSASGQIPQKQRHAHRSLLS